MSIDIDLTTEDDPIHVSVLNSAGVYRVFVGENGHNGRVPVTKNLALSAPLSPEGLKRLKQLLDSFDLEEYEQIFRQARLHDIKNGHLL